MNEAHITNKQMCLYLYFVYIYKIVNGHIIIINVIGRSKKYTNKQCELVEVKNVPKISQLYTKLT